MVSAYPSCIYTELCYIVHDAIGDLSTVWDIESIVTWIVCCPFFHNSPPNCTFGYNLNRDKFEDSASYLAVSKQTRTGVFSVWILHHVCFFLFVFFSAAAITSLSLTALRWHSVAVESRTLPECQYQPLFTNKQKCQMPLARNAGTLNYHSHCHGNDDNSKLLML